MKNKSLCLVVLGLVFCAGSVLGKEASTSVRCEFPGQNLILEIPKYTDSAFYKIPPTYQVISKNGEDGDPVVSYVSVAHGASAVGDKWYHAYNFYGLNTPVGTYDLSIYLCNRVSTQRFHSALGVEGQVKLEGICSSEGIMHVERYIPDCSKDMGIRKRR